jgi:cell division protein FtsN
MPIPTSPVDKNWPKGPNFLGIVLGAAAAMIILFIVAYFIVRGRAQKMIPTKTSSPPSQTMLQPQLHPTSNLHLTEAV